MPKRQMACEKEMSCVRGYHVYKDTWAAAIGEVLVCKQGVNQRGKSLIVKVKYFCTFSLYEIFLQRK